MKFYSLDACIRRRLKTIHIRYCGSHFRLSSLNYADMATADISLRVNHATIYLAPTCLIREILPDLHIYLYSATRIFITSYIICDQWSHRLMIEENILQYALLFLETNRILCGLHYTVWIAVFLESTRYWPLHVNNNRHLKDHGVKLFIYWFLLFLYHICDKIWWKIY